MRFARWAAAVLVIAAIACQQRPAPTPEPSGKKNEPAPAALAPPEKNKPALPPAIWETYHGPASLAGASAVTLPDTLAQVWRFDMGAAVTNTPVAGHGRVCVADAKGGVHGLDLTGKPVWSKTFLEPTGPGSKPLAMDFSPPLVLFDSTLIACATSGKIYAMNAIDGELRWACYTEWPILGSPNVSSVNVNGTTEKKLFVIDESSGALQCLDFASGRRLWKSDEVARCDGSPALNGSMAVYGSCACALHVFDTAAGKMQREIALDEDSQIAGGVVLLGESIYSGSRSGKFIHANARTGETIWTNTDCDGEVFSTPAVSDTQIVFGANNSLLYALDRKTGRLQWKQKLKDTPSSPVIAGDKVVVTAGGTLYLLRMTDGQTVWSYAVSDDVTSPALAGTLVLVGAGDGTLTAFGRAPRSKGEV